MPMLAPPETDEDENTDLFNGRDPFVPRDAFLSNKGCPNFYGTPGLPLPCSTCQPGRCWFLESTAQRKAGLPVLTPRDWRILVNATSPLEDMIDDGDDEGGFDLLG